jgi:hypothetical protein
MTGSNGGEDYVVPHLGARPHREDHTMNSVARSANPAWMAQPFERAHVVAAAPL